MGSNLHGSLVGTATHKAVKRKFVSNVFYFPQPPAQLPTLGSQGPQGPQVISSSCLLFQEIPCSWVLFSKQINYFLDKSKNTMMNYCRL